MITYVRGYARLTGKPSPLGEALDALTEPGPYRGVLAVPPFGEGSPRLQGWPIGRNGEWKPAFWINWAQACDHAAVCNRVAAGEKNGWRYHAVDVLVERGASS